MPSNVPLLYHLPLWASKSRLLENVVFYDSHCPIWVVDGGADCEMTGDAWGYLRTSRTVEESHLAYRVDALESYLTTAGYNPLGYLADNGTSAIYKAPFERISLLKLVSRAKRGNAIVCTTLLSRLIRKGKDGFYKSDDVEWLLNAGVRFGCIVNPFLSESEQHSQAIKLGLESAGKKCKLGGRPKTDDKRLIASVLQCRQAGMSDREIGRKHNIHKNTAKRIIEENAN